MHDKPLDILTLNETRLDDNISDKYIEISGYEIVRKDRNRIGGGVAIYYRDHLNVRNRDELVPEGVESVCVEVLKTKCTPLLISTIYRPPSSKVDIFEKIENLIQNLDNENKEIILAGDVNCDLLANVHSNHTNRLLTIANLFQLTQIIDEPTRVTEYTSTLVDWLMTNKPENISNTGVLHLGVSDHSLIYGCRKIAFSRNPSKLVESRCLKNYKSSAFKADLNECLFMSDWATNDPNALWNQFRNAFNYVADVHAPIKTRRVRSTYTPWLNKNIKTEMNYRDYLKK